MVKLLRIMAKYDTVFGTLAFVSLIGGIFLLWYSLQTDVESRGYEILSYAIIGLAIIITTYVLSFPKEWTIENPVKGFGVSIVAIAVGAAVFEITDLFFKDEDTSITASSITGLITIRLVIYFTSRVFDVPVDGEDYK